MATGPLISLDPSAESVSYAPDSTAWSLDTNQKAEQGVAFDEARRIAANIAKLPVLLRPQSDSGTAEYSGRCQAFSRSFELGYFDFGFRS